jgi:soluble lytic murein transglycosylase-like protein
MLIALLATCRLSATAWADDTSARVRTRSQHAAPKPALYEAEIAAAVESVRDVWPVPPELVRAVMRQESNFDPQALSRVGAIGLMQVMPRNGAKVGFAQDELWEPAKNIVAGVRLLAVYLKHYEGDLISALVAYNAHPIELGAPVPNNGETPDYVLRVLRYYRRYRADTAQESKP